MREPRRISEGGGGLAELLRAARDEEPSPETRERVWLEVMRRVEAANGGRQPAPVLH